MRLTVDVLNMLGSCGMYVERFREDFPETDERYADGVEVTPELCVEHADRFQWEWAYETMLNRTGQRRYADLVSSDNETVAALLVDEQRLRDEHRVSLYAWRDRHSFSSDYPPIEASTEAIREHDELVQQHNDAFAEVNRRRTEHAASVFGHLVTQPELRSDRLINALGRADELRDQREREEVERLERDLQSRRGRLDDARRYVDDYTRVVRELEELIPGHEQRLAEARRRYREGALRRAERRFPILREEYEEAVRRQEETVERLRAELAQHETTVEA